MNTRSFSITDIGLKRERNEDACLIDEQLGLYLVCDGMGGHAAGHVASSMATTAIVEHLRVHKSAILTARQTPTGYFALTQLVSDSVNYACHAIYGKACSDRELAGMGTTLTMLLLVDDKAVMAHVGDSRLYLYRKGGLHHLSNDHTLLNQLLVGPDADTVDPSMKHILTRAVGIQPGVIVDTLLFDVHPGDRFLLCTDGLSNCFEDDAQAAGLVSDTSLDGISNLLLNHALSRGGNDNITAVLVDVEGHDVSEDAVEAEGQLELLTQVPLFSKLSLARQLAITEIADVREFAAGETVLEHNAKCDGLHLVVDGQLRRSGFLDSVKLTRGSVFGEASLVRPKKSSIEIIASEDSRVLVIARDDFERLLVRRPKLGRRLLKRLVTQFAAEKPV
ncbi:MAG: serine/threonine protein phosphatase PrpC [Planctomycetaceae bacterium]